MAWVETLKLRSGQKRYRVVERAADGRLVKGRLMRSRRDADRLAGRTGIEKDREELGLAKPDYGILDLLDELPQRVGPAATPGYLKRGSNLS